MTTPTISLHYFSGKNCSVCHALKPKVIELLNSKFPTVEFIEIKVEDEIETAAQHMVFTLPVVLIKIDGQESARFVRSFSVIEIEQKLQRILSQISN
ncbi:MAG: thioredoxin family protein [Flavobacteriales bacterium]|nr:thioredoxin family protein [Flavobacteriales bacterium]